MLEAKKLIFRVFFNGIPLGSAGQHGWHRLIGALINRQDPYSHKLFGE